MLAAVSVVAAATTVPAASAEPPAPRTVCTVDDPRLAELSGMVADEDHVYAVSDGGTRIEIVVLGRDCARQRVINAETDPFDVEDLARGADGTFWLADTGDNRKRRETVALHAVTPDGAATLYRLRYPDGAHDAEALLLDGAGVPYIVTKNVLGGSGVYRPVGPLSSPGPVDLEKVGSLDIESTDTPGGPVGSAGSVLVTGAASAADGSVVAIRTYTDAYLYAVPDGDVLAAFGREPVRVPLPGERQGEAIAFAPDGALLAASEGAGEPLRSVPEAAALATARSAEDGDTPEGSPEPAGAGEAASADGAGIPALPAAVISVLVAMGALVGFRAWSSRRR
ncbi:hypothetical protein CFN78_05025 [Amycolatopsis antarctica]|uniref:Esterase-like activity of phytase family protein n=1 Tax=Amycolatopsis antarctica TaxID=1854586 RepID=A0A263DAW5_9PSEU|nr:hypothetical protein CFN78_05025 [Amycolatopsis antarctica]